MKDMVEDFKIAPIRNGTVIDHITSGQALNVLKILNVNETTINSSISVAIRAKSSKGSVWKDIIKIEDRELDPKSVDKIALIAPNATIAIIRDYYVAEKYKVKLDDKVCGLARCSNPDCITNKGEPVETEFTVTSRDPPILRCTYCDRVLINISDNLI
ncbi:MAG: aspartate carbamoyltransferase regulatory subunit [Thermoplasmata archaeon]|nr:aspartate carbamoyltransferase regulatory subunit [Thermoplasmata archaeon]